MEVQELFGEGAGDLLVFVHGWPDDGSLFEQQVKAVSGRHRCLLVTLPGFRSPLEKKWGFGMDELGDLLAEKIEQHRRAAEKVILVLHDWGSFVGMACASRHTHLLKGLILMDVVPVGKLHIIQLPFLVLVGLIYQFPLIFSFLVGGSIGNSVTRFYARILGAPNPLEAHASMNYPYLHFHVNALKGMFGFSSFHVDETAMETLPTLFIYGVKGPQFFPQKVLKDLAQRSDGSEVVAVKARHWLMTEKPEIVNEKMISFISKL